MDQHVAKPDDPRQIGHHRRYLGSQSPQADERLADDFKLAFDRGAQHLVRILLKNGEPSGEYEDFLTGFVIGDSRVWGRPVGVAVARDGALLVSEDANGTIWRVSYPGGQVPRP
jgi:glucose/arabinose dehydrogenase